MFGRESIWDAEIFMAAQASGQIDTVMQETRLFPPPAEFAARRASSRWPSIEALWDEAAADPPKFWAELAREELHWFKPFDAGARVERAVRPVVCRRPDERLVQLPRSSHLATARANRHGDYLGRRAGRQRQLTYQSCTARSASSPTCSSTLGIEPGDVVSIYMPMVPELAIAMLACARIGAVHSVIFARLFGRGDRRSQQRRRRQAA